MGLLSGKFGKKTEVETNEEVENLENAPLHVMFNPEKLARLSGKLGEISLNEIDEDNGLILQDNRIPEELLVEILVNLDNRSLIVCKLVCKKWFLLIRDIVWRRKAERVLHHPLHVVGKAPWTVFYATCIKKIPFGKNLIIDDSFYIHGRRAVMIISHWRWISMVQTRNEITVGYHIIVKHFKAPNDPMFNANSMRYIVSSSTRCWKQQTIYLLNEGFPQYMLDNLKPIIKISEWYRCPRNSRGPYECKIELIKLEESCAGKTIQHNDEIILDSYHFSKTFENRNHRGTWRKFKYQFKNYEKGLNRIKFYHGGENRIEIGGTCITLELPSKNKINKSL